MSATQALARFCASLEGTALPERVRAKVRELLLDHMAVALGGVRLPSSEAAYQLLVAMGARQSSGANPQPNDNGATLLGRGERAEAAWAALFNGVAAHGLEMDDVENRSSLHPGVAVFPAALALAEQLAAPIDDFYAAVVAGYELTLRIGAALNPASAYARGFHPTALCGTFGAAAASARLLGLSAEQTAQALGIAGSMAAGSLAYLADGAWTKRLHPGWSAHAGITAARLAAAGFRGPQEILSGRYGFLHAYSDASFPEELQPPTSAEDFAILRVSLKPYACCRYMHGPIDCLLAIRRQQAPDPQHIRRVRCGVLSAGRGLIVDPIESKRQPGNVVDAQFSMPFGAAVALITGQAGLSVFSETWLQHPEIRDLMQRVDCESDPELDRYYPAEWRATASVEMDNGQVFSASVRYPLGDPENPLSEAQLATRFHELAATTIEEPARREALIRHIRQLDRLEYFSWSNLL
ncbi:MAG: MmgE/PrpD family protein [Thermogemmatispora sp.]|uniref:MmgE/PrpD family protein n=1 Tax=Thermogemmatispora sp. TaxID=1968838 RepID=UPI00261866D6|nr:MmgE/PrpD family protein [Thermogemmatispora sp.]MBX5457356.1 MmgE/PrpD family protein [Thermogemmatispora sp.]